MSGELFRVVNPLPDAAQRNRCHTEKGSNDMLWDALNQIRMVFLRNSCYRASGESKTKEV